MNTHTFETEENVKKYFQDRNPFKDRQLMDVKWMTGGNVNYVYRLYFDDNSTAILKHSPPFLSSNPNFKFSQHRFQVEKTALKLFGDNDELIATTSARVPKLIYSDDENFLNIMEDAGVNTLTLKEFLSVDNSDYSLISFIAEQIFKFSKYLSEESKITRLSHMDPFENLPGWEILRNYYITTTDETATKLNLEQELEFVHDNLSTKMLNKSEYNNGVFRMGDLWPNSILIDKEKKLVWIIDWEGARFGTPLQDFEQLMGNLWIMKQNSTVHNVQKTEEFMRELELLFSKGTENLDWRISGGPNARKDFVSWVTILVQFDIWKIYDPKATILKALEEVKNL